MSDPLEGVPWVSVGAGERAPWADLSLECPSCGKTLPLEDSEPPGLTFIKCPDHGTWLRGQPDFKRAMGPEAVIRTESLRIETEALHRHCVRVQRGYEIERERRLVAEDRVRALEETLSEVMRADL